MPIISFTPKDKMLATVLEAGYQTFRIANIDGPKASKSGQSVNFFVDFEVSAGKYTGKTITVAFTSGSDSASILGSMAWMPTAYLRSVYAAVKGINVNDVPDQYDTDELTNQTLDGKVEVNTNEAGMFNTISQFVPAGKGLAAKAPF